MDDAQYKSEPRALKKLVRAAKDAIDDKLDLALFTVLQKDTYEDVIKRVEAKVDLAEA